MFSSYRPDSGLRFANLISSVRRYGISPNMFSVQSSWKYYTTQTYLMLLLGTSSELFNPVCRLAAPPQS